MPFVAIHNVNLSLHVAWPAKMRIIRIELVHVPDGAFGMGYGILSAPSADEENSTAHLGTWAEMQRVVEEGDQRHKDELLLESVEEDDVDGQAADGSHCALHGDVVVHDISRASTGPLTEMVVADAPFWLVPLLHRW
jgi:hypothetical protein